MIPILYRSDEIKFKSNGLGRLADCISCIVTEERNGVYELEFEYPVTGVMFSELLLGRIVAVTHDNTGDVQPFVIYKRTVPDLRGVVSFSAHHISYKLADIVVMPFEAHGCYNALTGLGDYSVNKNPFTFWTDKASTNKFKNDIPRLARNILGGEENSILDVFGTGDYEFDKFSVKLWAHRGKDSGLEIRYGKNLVSLSQDVDDSGTYNAIVPFWNNPEGGCVTLPEKIISYAEEGEEIDAAPLDMTEAFENPPTVDALRAAAKARYENSDAGDPNETISIDFVQLWETEEYRGLAGLQEVGLCDTVSVVYDAAGITKRKQKVVKVVYNALLERYDSIELGQPTTSLGQQLKESLLAGVPTNASVERAIKFATDLIRGGLGGYVVMKPNDDGYPEEILIMDQPSIDDAVNVIRMNRGGIAFSHNGYNGPFVSAWTMDGTFSVGGANDAYGIIEVHSTNDNWFGHLSSSGLKFYSVFNDLSSDYSYTGMHYSRVNLEEDTAETVGNLFFDDNYGTRGRYLIFFFTPIHLMSGPYGVQASMTAGANGEYVRLVGDTYVDGTFRASGTKSRSVKTKNYNERLLYAYETPTPLFGDIGEAVLDEDGICYVDLDDIFSETVETRVEYQVFLQKEGEGDCWIADKQRTHFVIEGTPGLKVAWELKAKQRDYEYLRLDESVQLLDEYETVNDDDLLNYTEEQEEVLYGDYDY